MTNSGENYSVQTLASRAVAGFVDRFGAQPSGCWFAPGRINLLGAHLDYSGGDVLPVAVDRGVVVAARLVAEESCPVRFVSLDRDGEVDLDGADALLADDVAADREAWPGWAAYPLGVWREFVRRTGRRAGIEAVFVGDLPIAAGLSSSAAIEVALGIALDALHGTELSRAEIARIGHAAETGFVGVPCGIMDQFASALAGGRHALLLHCHAQQFEPIPLAADEVEILVVDSGRPRELASERAFEQRVQECREAFAALRAHGPARDFLADYTFEEVEAATAAGALAGVAARRARHVVTEMQRMREGVASLRAGDLAGLGRAMFASHASTRDDYEVSCPELDAIVAAAHESPHTFGARLTGAGFGGCAVVLVRAGRVDDVERSIAEAFAERFGRRPGFRRLRPGRAPGLVS
jgi:galactokinase